MAIAAQENRVRCGWRKWDPTDAAYLKLLTDKTGYRPTAWEQARLGGIGHDDADENAADGGPDTETAGENPPTEQS